MLLAYYDVEAFICIIIVAVITLAVLICVLLGTIATRLKGLESLAHLLGRIERHLLGLSDRMDYRFGGLPKHLRPPEEATRPQPAAPPSTYDRMMEAAAYRKPDDVPTAEPMEAEPVAAAPVLTPVQASPPQPPQETAPPRRKPSPQPAPFAPPPMPVTPAPSPAGKSGSGESLEAKIGMRGLAVLGIIALLICLTFVLKWFYGITTDWGRVGIVTGVGIAMIAVGHLLTRKDYRVLAMVLLGGGPAAIFAAGMFAWIEFELIPVSHFYLASAWLIGTALLTIAMALYYDSRVLATVALVGGFAAPIIVGMRAESSPHLYFTYILVLNVGMLVLSHFKGWRLLNHLLFLGTAVCFTLFCVEHIKTHTMLQYRDLAASWLSAFFLLYYATTVLMHTSRPWEPRADAIILPLRNALAFTLVMAALLAGVAPAHVKMLGLIYFVTAALYAAQCGLLITSGRPSPLAAAAAGAIAALVATIAVPLALDNEWVVIGWAALAMLLLGLGLRYSQPAVLAANPALLGLALARLILFYFQTANVALPPLWNLRSGAALLAAVAILTSAWLMKRYAPDAVPWESTRGLTDLYRIVAHVVVLVAFTAEILIWLHPAERAALHVKNLDQFILSGGYAVYAIGLIVAGFAWKTRIPRILGLLLFSVAAVKACLFDVVHLSTGLRIGAFGLLGLMMLTGSYLYYANREFLRRELLGLEK